MAFEAVLFDCDGVLVDSANLQTAAEQSTASSFALSHGFEFDPGLVDWSSLSGLGRRQIAANLFNIPANSIEAEQFRAAVVDTTVGITDVELPLIEGVNTFIEYLVLKGLKLGLATSSDRRIYNKYCELQSIDYFPPGFIVAFGECQSDKPLPGQYLELMNRMHVKPEKTLVIEDSKGGITAGLFAGANVLALATTKSVKYLHRETDAHYVARNFRVAARQIQSELP